MYLACVLKCAPVALVIGVLGSGSGTNFQALADAIARGTLTNTRIGVVLADKPDAPILERARALGIPAQCVDPGPFKTKLDPAAEARYVDALREHDVELVVLAGFMRIVHEPLLAAYPGRIINVHPSLLPAFRGLAAWKQALEYGVKLAGVTIHLVDAEIDHGAILAQAAVPVRPDDTPETLHARIQEQEHRLYPEVVQAFADGRVDIADRRATIRPGAESAAGDL